MISKIGTISLDNSEVVHIPLYEIKTGELIDLPESKENTLFIGINFVKESSPKRKDLLVPTKIIRDDMGNIIGAKGLRV